MMMASKHFLEMLRKQGVEFFTGVPDSLLKHFLFYVQDHTPASGHIITANEGQAIALAAGYHLATGKLPLVYMQNSGLGNAVNPLTSLTDKEVYSIPMLLLIGWRGRPGVADEPQHKKMGRITEGLLNVLEIPYFILNGDAVQDEETIQSAAALAKTGIQPVALLTKEAIFSSYQPLSVVPAYALNREQVLRSLSMHYTGNEVVVCTTGKSGREFYAINEEADNKISKSFLSVGAMGLASQVALGIHLFHTGKIVMIDGDGAVLMQLGALTLTGKLAGNAFIHIVINNGAHESVGGQPTLGFDTDLCQIAEACGYEEVSRITTEQELMAWLKNGYSKEIKQFVEIRVNMESRDHLPRPSTSPIARKELLMQKLHDRKKG